MEISRVRNQLRNAIERARARAQLRRHRAQDAERAYEVFLRDVAIPVTRQVANALKAEGYAFSVSHLAAAFDWPPTAVATTTSSWHWRAPLIRHR